MNQDRYPALDASSINDTRDALHSYSRVVGGWLKSLRLPRKHWWHVSLRPSIAGLTSGPVRSNVDFELELDFLSSRIVARCGSTEVSKPLEGQSAAGLASWLDKALTNFGVDAVHAPDAELRSAAEYPAYSKETAASMHRALSSIAGALEKLQAGVREETSPIQVWPHHFDLSMIWLPGTRIPGEDPANEEYADKQMNFGFVFGDSSIDEPYLYVTGYPLPESLPAAELPEGTVWQTEGFNGAVLRYANLIAQNDPDKYLQDLWSGLMHLARPDLCRIEQ